MIALTISILSLVFALVVFIKVEQDYRKVKKQADIVQKEFKDLFAPHQTSTRFLMDGWNKAQTVTVDSTNFDKACEEYIKTSEQLKKENNQ